MKSLLIYHIRLARSSLFLPVIHKRDESGEAKRDTPDHSRFRKEEQFEIRISARLLFRDSRALMI